MRAASERRHQPAKKTEETTTSYRDIPRDVVEWTLSFVTDPRDFVRLRTVCKEWDRALGKLFFGTASVRTLRLRMMVRTVRWVLDESIPFTLAGGTLSVTTPTKHRNFVVYADCEMDTNNAREGLALCFSLPERVLFKLLENSNTMENTVFTFSEQARRIVCKGSCMSTGKWSLTSVLSTSVKLDTGEGDGDENDVKVCATASMLLSHARMTEILPTWELRLSVYVMNDAAFPRGQVLLISVMPLMSNPGHSQRFDYYFKRCDDGDNVGPTRWTGMHFSELDEIERLKGQRIVVKNDDLTFSGTYGARAIRDTLGIVDLDYPVELCFTVKGRKGGLFIDYSQYHFGLRSRVCLLDGLAQ